MLKFIERTIHKPIMQAALIFAAALFMMAGAWFLNVTHLFDRDPLFPWSIAAAFLLLFALLNSLMSLRADSFAKYWSSSMYSYLALALCNCVAAWLFSGIVLNEAGSYRWIIIVVTFGFLVFLSIVNFMKKIVQFAEREEWTAPRNKK